MARKANILLVEDDAVVRQALAHALSTEDFRVVSAANHAEAVLGLETNPIDVALVDVDLGSECGWDTFITLRRIQPSLSAIMMSARFDHRSPFLLPGVSAVMDKPLDLPLLFRTLSSLAAKRRDDDSDVNDPRAFAG